VLEEHSGFFKIQRRQVSNAREGKRPTITTKIRFAPSSSTAVLILIGELKRKLADLGIGFTQPIHRSAVLQRMRTPVAPTGLKWLSDKKPAVSAPDR